MKKIGLLWQRVRRQTSLAFVFIYLIAAWVGLYKVFKGIHVLIRE